MMVQETMHRMSKPNIFNACWRTIRSYIFYSEHFDPVLGLRGLACFIIIWYHLVSVKGWLIVRGIDLSFITSPNGIMAVFIFYLISGYSVGYGFFSKKYTLSFKSLRSFYINRCLRIIPAYYVCILACIFIFYRQTAVSTYDLVRYFTFTANFDYFNLPFQLLLAIISTEMQFYLIAPLLFLMLSYIIRKAQPLVVGFFILCLGIAVRYMMLSLGMVSDVHTYLLNVYVTVLGTFDIFLFGMFLSYLICERAKEVLVIKKKVSGTFYMVLVICWFLWVNYSNFPLTRSFIHLLFIFPLSLCLVIGWYILSSSVNYTYKERKETFSHIVMLLTHPKTFFYGIGSLSYGLYLYHFVFIDLLYIKPGLITNTIPSFLSRSTVVFTITVIIALISYAFVESPFLRLKHK